MPKISVVIIAFNEAPNIHRCIESVRSFANEIVVVDSMSADSTGPLCEAMGCKVFRREFDGYGTQKQFAVDQAAYDCVFSIDADEVVTGKLAEEIVHLFRTPDLAEAGFTMCFSLVYQGRKLKHGGAGSDQHLRLFNRQKGGFTRVKVHEGIVVTGKVSRLKGEVLHYSYRNLTHHLEKLNYYTTSAAEGYVQKGKRFSRTWVILKFPLSFIQFYILKGGFLDGYPGFLWSLLAALYAVMKIAKSVEITEGTS